VAAMTSVGRKMAIFQMFYSVQDTGGSPTGRDLYNRVGDQTTGRPGMPAFSGLQVQSEPWCCRARLRSLGELPATIILKKSFNCTNGGQFYCALTVRPFGR
jgi:hypothetical protein